jgi:hypothetical protein
MSLGKRVGQPSQKQAETTGRRNWGWARNKYRQGLRGEADLSLYKGS